VIGLTAALQLQEVGHVVSIVARDFPSPFETVDRKDKINYTSQWGGAHNRWVIPVNETDHRDHRMAVETFHHMKALCKSSPEAGITFMKGIEYLEDPPTPYKDLTEESAKKMGIVAFRLLTQAELPHKVTWGCEYLTWCVNPMVYCSYLLRRLVVGGCNVFQRELRSPLEVMAMEEFEGVEAVVNCSGAGFGDPDIFITRGSCRSACPPVARVARTDMQI
jgi:D-amino-acid oxidase